MSKRPLSEKEAIEKVSEAYELLQRKEKGLPAQKLIDDYIKKGKQDPKVIQDIIEDKRKATKQVISEARIYYETQNKALTEYYNSYKNYPEAQAVIEKIQNNIIQIKVNIYNTEKNVSNNVSQQLDKKVDTAKAQKKLTKLLNAGNQAELQVYNQETTTYDTKSVPSLDQLNDQLKYTNQALKVWKDLSKARDDTDRSKGFARLSDNLASMATTSLNAPRKALAFGQALLTYAVVDVLYTGLVKGTAKGLVKGANTGYSAANDAVKKTANNLHKMIVNPQKKLEKQVEKLMSEKYSEEINSANIQEQKFANKDKITALHEKLVTNSKTYPKKEFVSVKDYLDDLEPKDKATMLTAFLNETGNTKDAHSLQKSFDSAYDSQPSLPTRALAGAAGIVPAIVTGIVNAAWEGVKKPTLAATVEMPKGVGNRLTNLKKDKNWARTHPEVQEHRSAQKMAEALGEYARKTQPEQFNKMVQEQKQGAQKQKKLKDTGRSVW